MRVHLSLYLFSLVVLVALIFSCVKEDVSKDSSEVEALRGKSPLLQLDIATTPVLPVDMSQWYTSPDTKASGGEDNICFASLSQLRSYLLPDKALRNSFEEGYYYLETPLNLGSGCLKGAFSKDGTAVNDTLVGIKSFYVVRDNVFDHSHKEFLVTMIPSYSYLQENREYSYLFKRNFSGVAIYADTLGSFQKIVLFDRGRASQTVVNRACGDSGSRLSFYRYFSLRTKSGDDDIDDGFYGGVLDEVVVIADAPRKNTNTDRLFFINVDEKDTPDGGGTNADYWGDFGGGGDGRQDKPFKYEEDNAVKSYTVTLNAIGVITGSASINVNDSTSSVTISAEIFGALDGNTIFGWWMDGRGAKVSGDLSFQANITSDTTFVACFLRNDPLCQALARIAQDAQLGANVSEFLSKIGPHAEVETSLLSRVDSLTVKNDYFTQNDKGRVISELSSKYKYLNYIHNHPSNNPIPSFQDLITIYTVTKKNLAYDDDLFRFVITTDQLILYFYVVDKKKLIDYFDGVDKQTLDEWEKEYREDIKIVNKSDPRGAVLFGYLNDYYWSLMGLRVVFQKYDDDLSESVWQTEYEKTESNDCLKRR